MPKMYMMVCIVAALMALVSLASAFGVMIPGVGNDTSWGIHLLQSLGFMFLGLGMGDKQ